MIANNSITPTRILELAEDGWDAIVELYTRSSPEQRDRILKILGGLGAFGA